MERYSPYYARFLNENIQRRKKQHIKRILAVTTAVCVTISNPGVLQPLYAFAMDSGETISETFDAEGAGPDASGPEGGEPDDLDTEEGEPNDSESEDGNTFNDVIKTAGSTVDFQENVTLNGDPNTDNDIYLEEGTYYFAKINEDNEITEVFIFIAEEDGWYDLDGAVQVDEDAYNTYINSLTLTGDGIYLEEDTYYFEKKDGEVFIFVVTVPGWYDLDGAVQVDEDAYNAYIESLRIAAGGFKANEGDVYYYEQDGVIYKVVVKETGLYNLPLGAIVSSEAKYIAYIESLAVENGGIKLAVGTYYFMTADGEVFRFIVTVPGWYNLDGTEQVTEDDYDDYIAKLAVAAGGIRLTEGLHYFKDKTTGVVFVFNVTETGWYNLNGAKEVDEDAYTAYLEKLRYKDDNSIKLKAGTYYFEDEDGVVFKFIVEESGWFKLDGMTQVDEDAYNTYIEGLAIEDDGVKLSAGPHYFKDKTTGVVFLFNAPSDGWYDLNGAEKVLESDYITYIEGLRADDPNATDLTAGLHYFKDKTSGIVFLFDVTVAGWYDLGNVEEVDVDAYNAYLESCAVDNDGVKLTAGQHYFKKGGVVFIFDAPAAGWYDLGGAVGATEQEYLDYIESLRADDPNATDLTAGPHYFKDKTTGIVFLFDVTVAGWYDLGNVEEVDVDAYNAYLESCAESNGGFYLTSGQNYYYWLNNEFFVATADDDGWFKLPEGAEPLSAADYENIKIVGAGEVKYYIDGDGKLWKLVEGAYYIEDLISADILKSVPVSDTVKIGDYYIINGILYEITDVELTDGIPAGAMIVSQDRVIIGNGTMQYYRDASGELYYCVVENGKTFLLPDGASKIIGQIYTNDSGVPQTIYYFVEGKPAVHSTTIAPGGTFIFPDGATIITDFSEYSDRIIIASSSNPDIRGDWYYQLAGQWYNIRIVDNTSVVILPEGAQGLTKTKPNISNIITIGNNSAGTGTPLAAITITKINPDGSTELVNASRWTQETSSGNWPSSGTLYMDSSGNLYTTAGTGRERIGSYNGGSVKLDGDYSISVRWQSSSNYQIAELSGEGTYNLGNLNNIWFGKGTVIPTGETLDPEKVPQTDIEDLTPALVEEVDSKSTNSGALGDYDLGYNYGSLGNNTQGSTGDLEDYGDLGDNTGRLADYLLTITDELEDYDLSSNLSELLAYILSSNPNILDGFDLDEIDGELLSRILPDIEGFFNRYSISNPGDGRPLRDDTSTSRLSIADPNVPLAILPEEEQIVINEEEIPLADIPQTGVDKMGFSLAMLGLSLSALLAMAVTGRIRGKKDII